MEWKWRRTEFQETGEMDRKDDSRDEVTRPVELWDLWILEKSRMVVDQVMTVEVCTQEKEACIVYVR